MMLAELIFSISPPNRVSTLDWIQKQKVSALQNYPNFPKSREVTIFMAFNLPESFVIGVLASEDTGLVC